jgi:hypothetical protein
MEVRPIRTAFLALMGLMMSVGSAPAQWVLLGVDDCTGGDTGCSAGATPDPIMCDGNTSGTTAVCWDGVTYSNGIGCGSSAWCTYKSVPAPLCTGGSHPGQVYECTAPAHCPPTPESNCRTAGKALLLIKKKGGTYDRQLFKWLKGAAVMQPELADPTNATQYRVCVYTGNTNDFLEGFSVPAGAPNWSPVSDKGYIYKEPTGTNGGLTKMLLKGSATAGKSKVLVKGKGANLPDPSLTNMPVPVTVQVVNPDTGLCVEAAFDAPHVLKNEDHLFKAKMQQ